MRRHDHRVGVRELRQNLSVYLRRVAKGELLEVTDRGKVVAVLSAVSESQDPLAVLTASGRASTPKGDLLDLKPPVRSGKLKLSESLRKTREGRL
jgi:prevent-host-death family protein